MKRNLIICLSFFVLASLILICMCSCGNSTLKELPKGAKIIDIEKCNEIIYIITSDNELYVNGEHTHGVDYMPLGFDIDVPYSKRKFFSKYNPILVRKNVKNISIYNYGGVFIQTDNSLWCFSKVDGYDIPVKIAENVIDAAYCVDSVLYLQADNSLWIQSLTETDSPKIVAQHIESIKTFGSGGDVAVLRENGSLFVLEVFDGTKTEVANNVVAYSGEYGDSDIVAYVNADGKAYIHMVRACSSRYITDNAKDISLGEISLVLKNDGSVTAFGFFDGILETKMLNVNNAIDISADTKSSSVLTSDNTIVSWGMGRFGQFGYANSRESDPKSYTVDDYELSEDGYVFEP